MKIQRRKLSMVLLRSQVVSFGRLAPIAETAQVFSLAAAGDVRPPQSLFLIETNAFVAGEAPATVCIPGVLSDGCRAEIGLAIIKTILVNMIDIHIIWDFKHLSVHVVPALFAIFVDNRANSVEGQTAFGGEPFAFGEPKIIIRIDDGVLVPRQRYPAEGIAVVKPSI